MLRYDMRQPLSEDAESHYQCSTTQACPSIWLAVETQDGPIAEVEEELWGPCDDEPARV